MATTRISWWHTSRSSPIPFALPESVCALAELERVLIKALLDLVHQHRDVLVRPACGTKLFGFFPSCAELSSAIRGARATLCF
jgi:hypothetical protein